MDVKRLINQMKKWKGWSIKRSGTKQRGRSSLRRRMSIALIPTIIALVIVGALGSYQLRQSTAAYDRVLSEGMQEMLLAENLSLAVTDAERYSGGLAADPQGVHWPHIII